MENRKRISKFNNNKNKPNNRTNRNSFQSEFSQTILQVKRISLTTKGGRRPRFACLTLVKGKERNIGIAYAKGNDFPMAIGKSSRKAIKRSMIYWNYERRTVPYELNVKYNSTRILFKPAPEGCGIKAGSVINPILESIGIKDVSCKLINSNNKNNIIRCVLKALEIYTNKRMSF